jgi:hypothetical protein
MLVLFFAGYQKYKTGMGLSGIVFISNFVKISQLVQELKETQHDRLTHSVLLLEDKVG